MREENPLLAVIDDDESVREALVDLLRSLRYESIAFASADAFLRSASLSSCKCLLLDVAMPGMSGPELQRYLRSQQIATPIVFMTAMENDMLRARLLQDGAIDCLYKPICDHDLLVSLKKAIKNESSNCQDKL
jgi:FixJ family two-component response regulator